MNSIRHGASVKGVPPYRDGADSRPTSCDHEWLLATLVRASERAAQVGRAVVASLTWPVAAYDPLRIFEAADRLETEESFFWEQPFRQLALVGIGAASLIETSGPTRFTTAAAVWRELLQDMVVATAPDMDANNSGPVLCGGFRFDPLSPHTSLWEGFPDGLLVLPRMLFARNAEGATLTVNRLITASDDINCRNNEIIDELERLGSAIASEEISSLREKPTAPEQLRVQSMLPPSVWMEQVAQAVKMIQRGTYQKVVLARGVSVTRESASFELEAVLTRLRESYPGATVFAQKRGTRCFVGATPERLVYAHDGRLQTMALAGSAPRGATEEEDRRLGAELLSSAKNKIEHAIVVETIRDALAKLCSEVQIAGEPQLLKLKNIHHLVTPIVGELLPGRCVLETLQDLHPTPAVGGFPRLAALNAIRDGERLDRGWYAAPLGWLDASGNGEFVVALRSALIDGNAATLFAGNGIVADSDPESEYVETGWKLQVMLRALGAED
jgi:isochorismate synthase